MPVVLQLISSVGFFGAENVLLEIAKGLANTKYRPIVGVLRNSWNPHLELAHEASKYHLDVQEFECKAQFDAKTIFEIRSFIEQKRVSIIQPHGYKADFYSFFAGWGKKVKILATCHPWTETSYNYRAKFYSWLDKKILKTFNRVIAVSDSVERELSQAGIPKEKLAIIDNGIDINRFHQSYDHQKLYHDLKIASERIVIGTVGRLVEEKGHVFLLEATKQLISSHPSLMVIIIGEGPLMEKLNRMVDDLGLQKHVLLTGLRNDIPQMLALMKVFVLPSISEGLPMALLEAMASMTPIVATGVGNIPKLIVHERTGILINPGNPIEIKEGILKLLNDEEYAQKLAQNAHDIVVSRFSNRAMASQYAKYYSQICSEK
ncbi:MAG: glycosyltransferase family 4 protein [candidate division KSB1 bacterium]|nr:glycosyltransferase family 4 protein [candidate division KSB1 bacterium]